MPLATSLERRGAVYYWRRRPPLEIACRIGRSHLKISLRTMDSRTARFRAAQLSALAETLFAMPIPSILTSAQAHDLFKTAFTQHLTKLMALKEIDRSDGRRLDEIANIERVQGLAYRLLSQFGGNGGDMTASRERESLASRGVSEAETDRVLSQLAILRQASRSAQSIGKIERLLVGVGAETNARNVSASKTYYYRALGEALLRSADDIGDDLPYEELVEEAVSRLVANASRPLTGDREVRPSGPTVTSASVNEQRAATFGTLTILAAGETLCCNKLGDDKHWTVKTAAQARSIFDLFDRFMGEIYGSRFLADLRQDRLASFDQFLRKLPKNYGKSPKDKSLSIADIRRRASESPVSARGLAIGTRNRHWTFLAQLIAIARRQGEKIDNDLEISVFHVRQTTLARDQRPVPSVETAGRIFHTLIYSGYADWESMTLPGTDVYHRAAYWAPIIMLYTGMRREEGCGLAVDDIVVDWQVPYFNVRPNSFRRLKNLQSTRKLAIHPELLRLGFLDYVKAIGSAGHLRLFPDLYSPSSNSLLGDRLYDEIASTLEAGCATPHAYRHFFDDQLKKAGVFEEFRADLMGHAGGNETTNRYCDPVEVIAQIGLIGKLPNLTSHLTPAPVRLLQWVALNQVAPWSRASKSSPMPSRTCSK